MPGADRLPVQRTRSRPVQTREPGVEDAEPTPSTPRPLGAGRLALWLGAYAAAALLVLAPARGGDFVSDDIPSIRHNPYVQSLSLENLAAILDPSGEPALNTFNYAPAHVLALALEWRLFGEDVRGYHVVNALVHALAAGLLAALLAARGLGHAAAFFCGALFLVHPANVEAAAWIYQIKTTGAAALALGALLLERRRPAAALLLFALALLTKAIAAFALPMAVAFAALDGRAPAWRTRALWLAAWAALLVPYAFVELAALGRMEASHAPLHPDAIVNARSAVALAGRYLWIAATGSGVAPSHDPTPALSWADPWWIAGLALPLALAARCAWAWRRRREETAWWIGAAAGYLPVAQIGMAFLQPMADRYLYCALPGLLGGCAVALRDTWLRRVAPRPLARRAAAFCIALGVAWIALFAAQSFAVAHHWRSAATLALASAARYPEGLPARLLEAQRAALRGDAGGTVQALRAAMARGYDRFETLASAPVYDAVRRDPAFQALLREMAQRWIDESLRLERATQADLLARAEAYAVLGERERALATLDEALRLSGPLDPRARAARLRLSRPGP
jgi:hypothetical protein